MDYTGISFNPSDNLLEYDANGGYGENHPTPFRELFRNDNLGNDSLFTAAETFSNIGDSFTVASDSFATQVEYGEEQVSNFEPESGEYRESRVILMDGSDHFGVSTTIFDSKEELIWSGNQGGHVTSYLSADMMKYTSFQVHLTEEIRDLSSVDEGILALTPTTLNMRTRQGIKVFTQRCDEFENMQCMLPFTDFSNRILIGGHQSNLLEFDLTKKEIINTYDVGEDGCVILRNHPRFICHGDMSGKIYLHDPRTLRQEHSFQAHNASLSDFDCEGNHIVTCGFSKRMGQVVGDQFVMVFDIRMMKMALPLRALVPPYFLRIMPGLSPCLAAVSLLGQWAVMDASQPENSLVSMNYQLSSAPDSVITSFGISSSSQVLVFGDSHGSIYLFSTGKKPVFNNFSQETELPLVEDPLHHIPIVDKFSSFSVIPLYIPDETLLSDWPKNLMKTPYWRTPPVDPQILQAMRTSASGNSGVAPNIFNRKRNQVPYIINSTQIRNKPQLVEQQNNKKDEGSSVHVPRRYRKIEIKYSKMGLDEFDFDSYNRTSFSGLDMSLPNSYCNPMIQMFYYVAPLRAALLSHLCEKEFCLACELGFLFHMLDINVGQGMPCHAANFLRAFRTIPEASAMSLTISDQDNRARINFASKIQSWNLFVLQQIHSETLEAKEKEINNLRDTFSFGIDAFSKLEATFKSPLELLEKPGNSPVSDIFGANILSITKCTRCGHSLEKDATTLTFNLSFHESARELSQGSIPFSTVVQNSLCLTQVTQAWCDSCSKYQPQEQFKRYKSLPSAIAFNCGLDSTQDLKVWQTQHEYLLSSVHEQLTNNAQESRSSNNHDENSSSPSISKKQPEFYRNNNNSPMKQVDSKIRLCRYGTSCVRLGCRFWHPSKDKDEQSTNQILSILDQTMEYSWIPLGMKAKLNSDGSVIMKDIPKEELESCNTEENEVIYDLMGVICHVSDPRFPDKNNLVSCIKVGPTYHQRSNVSPVAHWYLFNDISILPITMEEAVWFPCSWKTPCVLYWIQRTLPPKVSNIKEVNPITADVFMEDKSLAQRGRRRITFTPLTADEMPEEGEVIAMDAEFVNLHQEEAEIRSDGTKTTIKPSQKSVARITCIRGMGPLTGTPFLDDYISTQEQVVDYLTQFSGIKPGDLDANYSQKHLTTLKSTYVKLRYLIDRGVKIVGHGLKNDFRWAIIQTLPTTTQFSSSGHPSKVINMVVPQNQLIDTVHLYHIPHNRMISLKFLAWHFLNLKIQSVTHDSIEDAKTALSLYQDYLRLSAMGEAQIMVELQKMYDIGKKLQWKVPGEDEEE